MTKRTVGERVAWFIGETARPLSIIATSFAGSYATVVAAHRVLNGNDAALFIAAVFAGLCGLYWGKAWEKKGAHE